MEYSGRSVVLFWFFIYMVESSSSRKDVKGPTFQKLPPTTLAFLNTESLKLKCLASGNPDPQIEWHQIKSDGQDELVDRVVPLRDVRDGGTLIIMPFHANHFRQDIHSTIYYCVAKNVVGKIRSHNISIKAVIKKSYDVSIRDTTVSPGGTAVLVCDVPAVAKDFVKVISWQRRDGLTILVGTVNEKYIALENGHLLVNIVGEEDEFDSLLCETENIFTKRKQSSSSATIKIKDAENDTQPEITFSSERIEAEVGVVAVLPCAAQGLPSPMTNWQKFDETTGSFQDMEANDRLHVFGGSLVISGVRKNDVGRYRCIVNNFVGQKNIDTTLLVKQDVTANIEPKVVKADVGEDLTISCKIEGLPVESVVWTKDAEPIGRGFVSRFDVVEDSPRSSDLHIKPVESSDSGMYQCIVSNDDSSATASVRIILGRMSPIFVETFGEMTYQPGPSITLSCSAKGTPRPRIEWSLGGESINSQGRFKVEEDFDQHTGNVVSKVSISSIRVEDSGYYECLAHNEIGSARHSVRLNVYGLPNIRPMRNRVAIAGQQTFVVHCNFGGYPIHKIWWTKDGMEIPYNHRQKVFDNGTLILNDVRKSTDQGRYTCTAQNKHGNTAHGGFDLSILRLPVVQPFYFMEDLNSDDVVQVSCSVTSGDPPFEFRWLKDGKPIAWGLGVDIQTVNRYSSVLFVQSLQKAHEGNYTCVVSNNAGSRSHSASLYVTVPPKWKIMPKDREMSDRTNIIANCQVTGYPPPVIIWKKSGQDLSGYDLISTNSHRQVYSNGSLSIINVTAEDSGRYLCQASNGVGTGISKVINIKVRVLPRFDTKYEQKTVLVGSDVVLVCSADGDKPLTAKWSVMNEYNRIEDHRYRLKDEEKDSGILSTLIIFRVSFNDSRNITCEVSNPYGKAVKTVQLIVQDYPPKPEIIDTDEVKSRYVKLSWRTTSPKLDRLTFEYIVQCKNMKSSDSWDVGRIMVVKVDRDKHSATIDNLEPDSVYECRVFGQSDIGRGESSKVVTIRTLQLEPKEPPTNIEVKALNSTSVFVQWKAPSSGDIERGRSIQGFNVFYKNADDENSTTKKYDWKKPINGRLDGDAMISGLMEYTKYLFTVSAYNQAGQSPRSNPIDVRTSEGVPKSPPRQVVCEIVSSSEISLSWSPPPPKSINGKLVGYTVMFKLQGDTTVQSVKLSKESLSVILQKLKLCSNYSIVIAASTKIGDGMYSDAIWCRTQDGIPGVPAGMKVVQTSNRTMMAVWSPPVLLPCQLTNYKVYIKGFRPDDKNITVSQAPYWSKSLEIDQVELGRTYQVWMTSSSDLGESRSTQRIIRTMSDSYAATIAGLPSDLRFKSGRTFVLDCEVFGNPKPSRKWKSIYTEENENSDIEMHRNGSLIIRHSSREDSGKYQCIAENDIGQSVLEYMVQIIEDPKCPRTTVKALSEKEFLILLDNRDVKNDDPITDVILRHRIKGTYFWSYFYFLRARHDDKARIKNLKCGTTYEIQLECYDKHGEHSVSEISDISTNGSVPVGPQQNEFMATNGSNYFLRLGAWKNGGCQINKFEINYKLSEADRWRRLTSLVDPEDVYMLPSKTNLNARKWHSVQMIVNNEAGRQETVYEMHKAAVKQKSEDKQVASSTEIYSNSPLYADWKIILPSVGAVVLILIVIITLRLYQVKRKQQNSDYHGHPTQDARMQQMRQFERRNTYLEGHEEYLV